MDRHPDPADPGRPPAAAPRPAPRPAPGPGPAPRPRPQAQPTPRQAGRTRSPDRPGGPRTPRPAASRLAFHASRIVTDIGVLLVLGSMSMSFVTGPSRSAMALDALPALLLVAPIFVITLIPDHTRPLPRPLAWLALVLALAALPYAIVKYLDAALLAGTLGGGVGLGARVLVFGTFVTVVGVAVGLTRSWMGLPSGGSPARRAAMAPNPGAGAPTGPRPAGPTPTATPRTPAAAPGPAPGPTPVPRPAGPLAETFGDSLFDSLEVPVTRADEPPPVRQPGLVFDAGGAAERRAERRVDDPDDDQES